MKENIDALRREFEKISKEGWIESVCLGSSGIGATFEYKIGLDKNELEIPDFYGIEIKTKRDYSNAYTTLFNATCDGKYLFELKRIRETYGWPDAVFKDTRVLFVSLYANEYNNLGYKYRVKAEVNYSEKKVFLNIYDKDYNLLESEAYWSFDLLEEKLLRKLKYLAFIRAKRKFIGTKEYFHYNRITFYRLRSFDDFLMLIEKGIIRITIKIGVYRHGKKMGNIYDHGTGFEIKHTDLEKLYIPIDSKNSNLYL